MFTIKCRTLKAVHETMDNVKQYMKSHNMRLIMLDYQLNTSGQIEIYTVNPAHADILKEVWENLKA